jgi:DNA polymerase III gamma/tau subunit
VLKWNRTKGNLEEVLNEEIEGFKDKVIKNAERVKKMQKMKEIEEYNKSQKLEKKIKRQQELARAHKIKNMEAQRNRDSEADLILETSLLHLNKNHSYTDPANKTSYSSRNYHGGNSRTNFLHIKEVSKGEREK